VSRIKMEVGGIVIDPASGKPIVMLSAGRKQMSLPMWVGILEATAIAGEMAHVEADVHSSHRFAKAAIEMLGGRVTGVAITGLSGGSYTAVVHVRSADGRSVDIPARASEAVALALSCEVSIYVEEEVLALSRELPGSGDPREPERLRELLESLEPEDFGHYEM